MWMWIGLCVYFGVQRAHSRHIKQQGHLSDLGIAHHLGACGTRSLAGSGRPGVKWFKPLAE